MAFSLFGKKPTPPPRKVASRKPAAPKPPEQPAPPPARSPDADKGLDAPAPKAELPELDFTVSAVDGYTVIVDDESMNIREGSSRVHPLVEEVAIHYANGNADAALRVATSAIERTDLGTATEQVWGLLFDLYQALGRREDFDKHALDYVVRFEKSPPPWLGAQENGTAARSGMVPMCNLSGALSAASAKQFEQMRRIVSKNPVVRLDVARVNSADAEGCSQLNELLASAKKQKRIITVEHASVLAGLLQDKLEIGKRENQTMWLLLLELLQQQGQQEAFDEWALNYAITFEVSPPSWEPPAVPKAESKEAGRSPAVDAKYGDAFAMSGEMVGGCTNELSQLNEYAKQHDQVVINLSALQRMDFVCAGMLLNTLAELAVRGKTLRLVNASCLVVALLSAVGINQIAEIIRRRT